MTQQKLIDIIIPAYNSSKTIVKTLSSIVMQSIVDKCKITIVNDGGEEYYNIIEKFDLFIDIEEIDSLYNEGAGAARQTGIYNTNCPYITFIDADDTYESAVALEMMLKEMNKYDRCIMISAGFLEQAYLPELELFIHDRDPVTVFCKIYKRNFIEKLDIKFSDTRTNEDAGFNTLLQLCRSNDCEEEVLYLDKYLGLRSFNEESITRKNGFENAYKDNLPDYVESMIFAIRGAEERNPFNSKINDLKIELLVELYYLYNRVISINDKYKKENIYACVKYYNEIFKNYEKILPKNYLDLQIEKYAAEKIQMLHGILPELTLLQFIEAIRSAQYESRKVN